jgi:hypothetical protein
MDWQNIFALHDNLANPILASVIIFTVKQLAPIAFLLVNNLPKPKAKFLSRSVFHDRRAYDATAMYVTFKIVYSR